MSRAQLDMFAEQEDLFPAEPILYRPDPAVVRGRLLAVLEQARAAERMPWDGKRTQFWQTVFPQMANWLPEEEAAQLRFEFARELERLKAA